MKARMDFIFVLSLCLMSQVAYSMHPHLKLREKIERLIEEKGDLNAPLSNNILNDDSPLLEMAWDEEDADLLEKLLQNGADPNVVDSDGNTALHLAPLYANVCGARLLLKYGANPNMKGCAGKGWTPLGKAARQDMPSLDLVTLLLGYNADPNMQDRLGKTALSAAVSKLAGDNKWLKTWEEKNVTWMIKYEQGNIRTRKEIIKILLYHGANPLITSTDGKDEGKNAIDIARKKGLDDIVELLQNARPRLIAKLTALLSRGQSPFVPEIARMIAEFRYSYDGVK